jgi:PiT family inorganic phosphate transporter
MIGSVALWILIAAAILSIYCGWNIGGNDVANSMASAVGAKAISLKQAVMIAAILDFLGAVFVGTHVTDTVRKGIVDPMGIGDANLVIIGMFAAMLGSAIWVTLATWKALPISTSHAIIGGVVGFSLVAGGIASVNWYKVGQVAASWVISPFFAGILAFITFRIIARFILGKENEGEAARNFAPIFIGITFFIMSSSLLLKTRIHAGPLSQIIGICLAISIASGIVGYFLIGLIKVTDAEGIFRKMQIMTSCYVAFSHGANDVANAIGPMAAIYSIVSTGELSMKVPVPPSLLVLGGIGITIGIMTWGYKVIRTVGEKITKINNTRGFSIDFGVATSVLLASKLGMPVSTTHAVIGAVVGVGLARGLEAVDFRILKKIVISWAVTIPAAALTSMALYIGFVHFFM